MECCLGNYGNAKKNETLLLGSPPPLTLCSVVVCSLQFYFANYDEKLFLCFLHTIYPALKLQNLSKADVIILGLAEEAASHGGTLNENKIFPMKRHGRLFCTLF